MQKLQADHNIFCVMISLPKQVVSSLSIPPRRIYPLVRRRGFRQNDLDLFTFIYSQTDVSYAVTYISGIYVTRDTINLVSPARNTEPAYGCPNWNRVIHRRKQDA